MNRYDTDRALGFRDERISQRNDPRHSSDMAEQAEACIGRYLGVPWFGDLGRADDGFDLQFRGWLVDVKWCEVNPEWGVPALNVAHWKHRRADLYVLTFGQDLDLWLEQFGYATRTEVEAAPLLPGGRRLSSGERGPYYRLWWDQLHPLTEMLHLEERDP